MNEDSNKLTSVMDNLLTNAMKYTPEDGWVEVKLAATETLAVIDVRDSGPGVATDELEAIFAPFVQGSARYQSSVKGTGLGLSLARQYVTRHGGKIEALACANGAHFRVELPLDRTGLS